MHYGMDKKNMLRKKAMESMMKEGPSIAIKIAKKDMMDEEPEMNEMGMLKGEKKEGGFLSMMVSPEEKDMLMMMRKKKMGMDEMMPEEEKEMA